tara:strand:- start:1640 stop:2302 length:663 start_codon:yes stop_codon:yes gene_type:complete
MATYRAIANSEVSVDAPCDTELVTAVANNCIALVEGGSGAPKIPDASWQNSTPITSGTVTGPSAGNKDRVLAQLVVINGEAGSNYGENNPTALHSQNYTVKRAGTYTIKVLAGKTSEQVGARLYVNGVLKLTTTLATSGNDVVKFVDVTIAAGQNVKLHLFGTNTGSTWHFGQVVATIYQSQQFFEFCNVNNQSRYFRDSATVHRFGLYVDTFVHHGSLI